VRANRAADGRAALADCVCNSTRDTIANTNSTTFGDEYTIPSGVRIGKSVEDFEFGLSARVFLSHLRKLRGE
jgi:hypothetical protein